MMFLADYSIIAPDELWELVGVKKPINPPATYTITYNANGGTGQPANQTKTENIALTLSTTVPVRTGYTFKGWATSAGAIVAQYQPGGSYTANAGATLFAVWELNSNPDPDPDPDPDPGTPWYVWLLIALGGVGVLIPLPLMAFIPLLIGLILLLIG